MGVRTSLLAVTLSGSEIAALQAATQDGVGTLEFAVQKTADAIATLTAITNVIPAGSNKTALLAQITALT